MPTGKRIRLLTGLSMGAVIIIASVLSLPRWLSDRRPADFRIEGASLAVTNAGGRELWRFETGLPDLESEVFFRARFRQKGFLADPAGERRILPLLLIRDLDRDGKAEILFAPRTRDGRKSGRVMLLDSRGRILWDMETGTEMTSGGRGFPPEFCVQGIALCDFHQDARPEILVISASREGYPTRVLLLDFGRNVLGEYWHAGSIGDYEFVDLDRDEIPEILLAGRNEEYGRPALFVLDARRMVGSSPQTPAFRFEGREAGSERYYLLFPPTPLDLLDGAEAGIDRIIPLLGERFQVLAHPSRALFELNYDLKLLTVTLSRGFESRYGEEVRSGRITVPYDADKLRRALAEGVRWRDGETKSWVNRRAASNPPPAGK